MRLTNQEIMKEFYSKIVVEFPNLSLEECATVCHTPFQFLRDYIEGDEIVNVRLKYLGSFLVFPGRAKNYLYNLEKKLEEGKIDLQVYERLSKMLKEYLKKLDEQ